MKLFTEHRKSRSKEIENKIKDQTPETWDPKIPFAVKDLPFNYASTVMWPAYGSMANFLWDEVQRENRTGSKDPTLMVEKESR